MVRRRSTAAVPSNVYKYLRDFSFSVNSNLSTLIQDQSRRRATKFCSSKPLTSPRFLKISLDLIFLFIRNSDRARLIGVRLHKPRRIPSTKLFSDLGVMLLNALLALAGVAFASAFTDQDIEVMSFWNTRPSRIVSQVRLHECRCLGSTPIPSPTPTSHAQPFLFRWNSRIESKC